MISSVQKLKQVPWFPFVLPYGEILPDPMFSCGYYRRLRPPSCQTCLSVFSKLSTYANPTIVALYRYITVSLIYIHMYDIICIACELISTETQVCMQASIEFDHLSVDINFFQSEYSTRSGRLTWQSENINFKFSILQLSGESWQTIRLQRGTNLRS